MATSSAPISSSLFSKQPSTTANYCLSQTTLIYQNCNPGCKTGHKRVSFKVQAAKLPAGVELPKVQPKFKAPFLGFTRTAEIWNSRACMIGLIGTFIVELILNKGILQVIGVDIGKGLDLPL